MSRHTLSLVAAAIATRGSSVVSSSNATTQANGFQWSTGAFGTLVTGKFSSP